MILVGAAGMGCLGVKGWVGDAGIAWDLTGDRVKKCTVTGETREEIYENGYADVGMPSLSFR